MVAVVVMTTHCYYGYTATGGPVGVGEAVGRSMRLSLVTMRSRCCTDRDGGLRQKPELHLTV